MSALRDVVGTVAVMLAVLWFVLTAIDRHIDPVPDDLVVLSAARDSRFCDIPQARPSLDPPKSFLARPGDGVA